MTLGLALRIFVGAFIAVSGLMLSAYVDGAMVYAIGLVAGLACAVAGALLPNF